MYPSPNVIKSRRIRWVGRVAFLGKMRNMNTILVRKLKERDHLGHIGTDGTDLIRTNFTGVNSHRVAQNRVRSRVFENRVCTFAFHKSMELLKSFL